MRVQRGHDVAYRQHNKSIKGKKNVLAVRTRYVLVLRSDCDTLTIRGFNIGENCNMYLPLSKEKNSLGQLQGVNILANLHKGTNDNGNRRGSSRKQC
ncbi:hypothetical protein MAR_034701 [Mya arenaria]|uniref:Uncharacterized protein n=1 Tax=Mya arenaria TaxID=6604 RepID=A0ABY7EKC7_MYAAR|nr:hypothetical protein MAR_034701 [Mya arenaria]